MTTATRPLPPHGTEARYCPGKNGRPGCRCKRCCRAAYMANIRRAQGRAEHGSNLIDRDLLAEHIGQLLASGMSQSAIARAAGVSLATISYLVRAKTRGCMREKALRILAVQPNPDPASLRQATGTIRRVRALYAIGHGSNAIAQATGLSGSGISHIANGLVAAVTGSTAMAVQRAYRALAVRPGTSHRAWTRAAAEGWASPAAWGDDIDDPAAQPELGTGEERRLARDELAQLRREEIWLLKTACIDNEEIAARLDMSKSTVAAIRAELNTGRKRDRRKAVAA